MTTSGRKGGWRASLRQTTPILRASATLGDRQPSRATRVKLHFNSTLMESSRQLEVTLGFQTSILRLTTLSVAICYAAWLAGATFRPMRYGNVF
jgi:hypothetical protein